MTDPRIVKMADLLVNYCVAVQPRDRVMLIGSYAGMPLLTETIRHIIAAGGHPDINWIEDEFVEIALKEANDDQLRYILPTAKLQIESYECYIRIGSSKNTRFLSGIDPARQRVAMDARRELTNTRMARAARGELRWVGTMFPTEAYAQDADMSLTDYEEFVYGACFADKDDPVGEWKKLSKMQQRLVDWLAGKKEVKVKGENIDLSLSIANRVFVNSDGKRNMPSGEIFTGPVEDSVNGWARFSYPSIVAGREVDGIELRFEDGKVVDACAQKNEEYLLNVLDTDEGSRYLGEFAIGTNKGIQRFTKSILFDEKIGGTIHMAVGLGYPETGSKNRSAVHWDMICDMRDGGQIWVDDELFYEGGEFLI